MTFNNIVCVSADFVCEYKVYVSAQILPFIVNHIKLKIISMTQTYDVIYVSGYFLNAYPYTYW